MVHNHCRRTGVVRDGQVAGIIRKQHLFFELERVLPQRRPTTPARKRLSLAPVPFPGPFRDFNGSAPILSHTHPGILNFFLSTIRIAQVNGKHYIQKASQNETGQRLNGDNHRAPPEKIVLPS